MKTDAILMPLLTPSQLRRRWKEGEGPHLMRAAEDILRGHVEKADWASQLSSLQGSAEVAPALDLRGVAIPSLISIPELDLSCVRFDWALLSWGFGGSNLNGAVFNGADGKNVDFGGCLMSESSIVDANLPGAVFYGANLENADLTGIKMRGGQLKDAVCRNAKFIRGDLRMVWAAGSDLRGADFQGANLIGASLGGVRWDLNSRFDGARLGEEGTPSDLAAYAISQGASVGSEKPEWQLSLIDATVRALQSESSDEDTVRMTERLRVIRREVERNPGLLWANILRPEVDEAHWSIFQKAVQKAANNLGSLLD